MTNDPTIKRVTETESIDKLFLELSQVTNAKTAREILLEDLLRSAHCIAERRGEGTAWRRFASQCSALGVGSITAKVFKLLPGDDAETA